MAPVQSISFAAAAFNAIYYVGVLHYLQTHPHRLSPRCLIIGTSSGSVFGPLLVCGVSIERLMGRLVPFMQESHRLKNFWSTSKRFLKIVFDLLPDDAYKRCSHRCMVVYTKVSFDAFTAVRRSTFSSNKQFFRYIRASCCIPLITDTAAIRLDADQWGIDGTFTENQPVVDQHTLRINATYRARDDHADIYPPPHVTSALPVLMELPPMNRLTNIVQQGYADAKHFFEKVAPPLFAMPALKCGEKEKDGAHGKLSHSAVHVPSRNR